MNTHQHDGNNESVDFRSMTITSRAFYTHGFSIQFGIHAKEMISTRTLDIANIPGGGKSLALIVEDPDAPGNLGALDGLTYRSPSSERACCSWNRRLERFSGWHAWVALPTIRHSPILLLKYALDSLLDSPGGSKKTLEKAIGKQPYCSIWRDHWSV